MWSFPDAFRFKSFLESTLVTAICLFLYLKKIPDGFYYRTTEVNMFRLVLEPLVHIHDGKSAKIYLPYSATVTTAQGCGNPHITSSLVPYQGMLTFHIS